MPSDHLMFGGVFAASQPMSTHIHFQQHTLIIYTFGAVSAAVG